MCSKFHWLLTILASKLNNLNEINTPTIFDFYLLVSRTPASPSTARAATAAAAAQSSSAQKRSPSSTDSGHSSNGAMGPSASGTPSAAYSRLTGNTPSGGSKRQTVHGGHPAKGNVQHHTVFVQGEDFEFIFLNGISSSLYIIFLYFFSNQRWFLKLD